MKFMSQVLRSVAPHISTRFQPSDYFDSIIGTFVKGAVIIWNPTTAVVTQDTESANP